MRHSELLYEVEKDLSDTPDEQNLSIAALDISRLTNKYIVIWQGEKMKLNDMKQELLTARRKLMQYYSGKMSRSEFEAIGKTMQFLENLKRHELDSYIEGDESYITVSSRFDFQSTKVDFIEKVLGSIRTRSLAIKNAIDYEKFRNGL